IKKVLPEAVSLDRITAIKPVMPGKADDSVSGQLLAAVNRLVSPPCLLAPGMTRGKEDLLDVDLSHLPLAGSFFPGADIPNRFIAVNPKYSGLQELTALFKENPPLAQFRWIEILLKESNLFPGPPGRILEKVSLRLVKSFDDQKFLGVSGPFFKMGRRPNPLCTAPSFPSLKTVSQIFVFFARFLRVLVKRS
ncbi:MAG: TGc protein, partial [Acidobacteriota bacterium]|nr:TGc protein [Acidobacteriota bacterium]